MNIRDYIINNFKDSDKKDIEKAIIDSINDKDEITLPGLGVLFEIFWVNSSNTDKEKIISILEKNIKKM